MNTRIIQNFATTQNQLPKKKKKTGITLTKPFNLEKKKNDRFVNDFMVYKL